MARLLPQMRQTLENLVAVESSYMSLSQVTGFHSSLVNALALTTTPSRVLLKFSL